MIQPTVNVTRCEAWPNGLGFNVTVNRVNFEISADKRLGRLAAHRLNERHEMTHFQRFSPERPATWTDNARELAETIYRHWRANRATWQAL